MSWIAAGASLLGGLIDRGSQNDANDANAAIAGANTRMQKEFAQKGISWRVADAQKAGVHPLYALGANLPTYSPNPMYVGADSSMGAALGQAGQDIGRAVDGQRTRDQRLQARLNALSVQRAELENTLLASQIARLEVTSNPPMQHSSTPPNRSAGGAPRGQSELATSQGNMPYVGASPFPGTEMHPVQLEAPMAGDLSERAGQVPEVMWGNVGEGRLRPYPNMSLIEDADVSNPWALSFLIRNNLLPTLGGSGNPPPRDMLPRGATGWQWNRWSQSYEPVYPGDGGGGW